MPEMLLRYSDHRQRPGIDSLHQHPKHLPKQSLHHFALTQADPVWLEDMTATSFVKIVCCQEALHMIHMYGSCATHIASDHKSIYHAWYLVLGTCNILEERTSQMLPGQGRPLWLLHV